MAEGGTKNARRGITRKPRSSAPRSRSHKNNSDTDIFRTYNGSASVAYQTIPRGDIRVGWSMRLLSEVASTEALLQASGLENLEHFAPLASVHQCAETTNSLPPDPARKVLWG